MRPAALLLAVSLVVVGCSSDADDPAPTSAPSISGASGTAIAPATCWGDARHPADDLVELAGAADTLAVAALEAQPVFTDPVDCAEPHGLEVYDVVTAADVDAELDEWKVAVDPDAEGHQALRSAVAAACRRTDDALSAAADATPLDVIPSPAFAPGTQVTWFPFPYDVWQAGERSFACALRQDEPGTTAYADFGSADLDPSLRVCLDRDLVTVACNEPHTREQLLVLTATPAVAAGKLPGIEAVKDDGGEYVDLSREALSLLDAECSTYYDLVASDPDEELVTYAELYPELWGEDEFSAVCTVSSPLDVAADRMVVTKSSVVG